MFQIFDLPRAYLSRTFEHLLPKAENAALLKALILGLKGEIQPETRAHFTDTGVVHILSVSGQHVGFVLIFLLVVSRLLRLTTPWRSVFLMVSLFYYAGLTGFNPPVLRAVLMAEIFLLGALWQRQVDLYNVLATAALVILLLNPYALFDVGFQLSFAAVFGMAFFYTRLHPLFFRSAFLKGGGWRTICRWLLELILVSIAAQLGTLPMTAIYFERVPLLATIANLVVVPLAQVIVMLGFILIFVTLIWPAAAQLLGLVISMLLTGVTKFVALLAAAPLVKFEVAQYSHFFILVSFILLLCLLTTLWHRRWGWTVIVLLSLANIFYWREFLRSSDLRVTFLDVGQGDAAVIELPDCRAFLIDAGVWSERFDSGIRTILPYLRRRQISRLEAIFISHSHSDHIGGVRGLLTQIPVKQIFTSLPGKEKILPDYRPLCDSLQIPLHYLQAGDTLSIFSPLRLQILSPLSFLVRDSTIGANSRSLVMRLTYGQHRFLFCGDIEHGTEQLLLPLDSLLSADILKVPHHGSVTSNTTAFLQKVKPAWAIISVGKWNRFNQPAAATLARFADLRISVVRTDKNGAVIFVSNGKNLRRLR